MPDLVGRTIEAANSDATVRRIKLRISSRDDPSVSGAQGVIVRQSIPAGSRIEPGSDVTVWLPAGVVVPELLGLGVEAARQRVAAAGLRSQVRDVVRERGAGQIVEQSPNAGTVVPRGSAVDLAVAVLEMVTVPDLRRRDRAEAERLLSASRLEGAFANDQESELPPGLVSAQDPSPGSTVAISTPVTVRLAVGVVVPSVVGATASGARTRLASAGLSADAREVRTTRAAADTVFEQTPAAGQRVARGSAVALSIARLPLVRVPDVRRLPRQDSLRRLAEARLKGNVSDEPASQLEPGLVVAQEPPPDTDVEAGSLVQLRAAVGVVVPSVVGAVVEEARTRADAGGLAARVTEVRTESASSGTVFSQKPPAGARVARGSTMELAVARPPLVTVPDLVRQPRDEAAGAAQTAGLAIAFEEDAESTALPDRVIRQDPPAGASVEKGTAVRVGVATGVSVPSVVNRPVQVARATIEATGLRIDEQGEITDGAPESTVLRQSPQANATVARGSVVRLIVAVRRTVAVPNLIGRARTDVEPALTSISLQVRFEEAPTANAALVGTVVGQTPAAGATAGPGAVVTVVIAVAQPIPPTTTTVRGLAPTTSVPATTSVTPTDDTGTTDVTPYLPWLVGLGVFSLLVYRAVTANRGGITEARVEPVVRDDLVLRGEPGSPIAEEPPEQPPHATPQVALDPHQDQVATRLEVGGSGLIQFEVRIRIGTDAGDQSLSAQGPFLGDERRIYE
jgi:beta-lactam-binding protein with PASTA domain